MIIKHCTKRKLEKTFKEICEKIKSSPMNERAKIHEDYTIMIFRDHDGDHLSLRVYFRNPGCHLDFITIKL